MAHPAFQPVIDAADEGQWKSVALIWGVEATLVVGVQAYIGLLLGIQNRMLRALATAAVCLGLDVGVDGFIGVYLSMADPPDVAGLEFFAQVGAGDGPGICLVGGVSLSGTRSFSILATAGLDVDMGIGAGYTKVSDR